MNGWAELKDRRVDRMLTKAGIEHTTIYYSPISIWIGQLVYVVALGFSILIGLWFFNLTLVAVIYFSIAYLFAAKLNHSVVISKSELIFVNPNFPFRSIRCFSLEEIERVTIDGTSDRFILNAFFLFNQSFLEVEVGGVTQRFYCIGIEYDNPFEGETELFLEDIYSDLKSRRVSVYCEGCL